MKSLARALLSLGILALPSVAFASGLFGTVGGGGGSITFSWGDGGCSAAGICNLANTILYLINNIAVPVIFALAFIVFLWGVFKAYIWSAGDSDAVSEGHRLILWGIIGFVVMISLWGLVNIVSNTFGLGGEAPPPYPTTYGY
jgi:hypothetical protein